MSQVTIELKIDLGDKSPSVTLIIEGSTDKEFRKGDQIEIKEGLPTITLEKSVYNLLSDSYRASASVQMPWGDTSKLKEAIKSADGWQCSHQNSPT